MCWRRLGLALAVAGAWITLPALGSGDALRVAWADDAALPPPVVIPRRRGGVPVGPEAGRRQPAPEPRREAPALGPSEGTSPPAAPSEETPGAAKPPADTTGAQPQPPLGETWDEHAWDEEDLAGGAWKEDEAAQGRLFLYKELVLSGLWSAEGTRLPPGDTHARHVDLSPRPPGSYIGVDLVRTFGAGDPINRRVLPSWLPLTAIDLHPRLVFDRLEPEGGLKRLVFAPQDFWLRFNPGGIDRLSLRVGQFVIPYGVNPVLAPRQRFILPVEAADLGLKWDWGVSLKGPAGEYDWEVAATLGLGESLRDPHLFEGSERSSWLLTGRFGTPTYQDLQYGVSFLYGDLPTLRAHHLLHPVALSRWRVGLDAFYRAGTYLMAGAQLTYGEDGHDGDAAGIMLTGGRPARVLGARVWVDYVLPSWQDLRLSGQLETVVRDIDTRDSDDTALTLEANLSISDSISVMLDYRVDFGRVMGKEDHALYLALIYYGL